MILAMMVLSLLGVSYGSNDLLTKRRCCAQGSQQAGRPQQGCQEGRVGQAAWTCGCARGARPSSSA